MKTLSRRITPYLLSLVLAAFACAPAGATVLVDLGFEDLVQQSALVFQGRVVGRNVAQQNGMVYTTVTFAVEDVVKGDLPDDSLALRFVGGTVGQVSVDIAGQYIPALNDHGLYFVNKDGADRINPLTGWYQGAFLIENRGDGTAYLDLSQRRDLILSNTLADPLARKMVGLGFSEQQIAERLGEYSRFPLRDFKDAVRSIVNQ